MVDKVPQTVTEGEKRNGWTQQSLNRYLEERKQQKAAFEMKRKPPVRVLNVSSYDPLKWGQ